MMLVGTDHTDYLVSAAVQAGLVSAEQASALGAALVRENVEAYLWTYFDGPDALDGWDELEDDEKDDELAVLVAWRDGYVYTSVPSDLLSPAQTAQAIDAWRYQVTDAPAHQDRPGWHTLHQLAAAIGPHPDRTGTAWIWTRPADGA